MPVEDRPSQVIQAKDDGRRRQWALQPFFRRDGRKVTAVPKAFVVLTVSIFAIGALVSLFTGGGELPPPTKSRIDLDGINHISSGLVDIPAATMAVDGAAKASTAKRSGKKARPQLGKLALIKRADAATIPPGSMFKARLVSGAASGPLRGG